MSVPPTDNYIDVGATTLYHEVRGTGPSLLLITGGTGDAGEWEGVAPDLAADFTVVSYDRRGFSRSPRPDGWTATSLDEQADDAAALLRALHLAPAAVIGESSGAAIACALVARIPTSYGRPCCTRRGRRSPRQTTATPWSCSCAE